MDVHRKREGVRCRRNDIENEASRFFVRAPHARKTPTALSTTTEMDD